jgi:hypothetical protein
MSSITSVILMRMFVDVRAVEANTDRRSLHTYVVGLLHGTYRLACVFIALRRERHVPAMLEVAWLGEKMLGLRGWHCWG